MKPARKNPASGRRKPSAIHPVRRSRFQKDLSKRFKGAIRGHERYRELSQRRAGSKMLRNLLKLSEKDVLKLATFFKRTVTTYPYLIGESMMAKDMRFIIQRHSSGPKAVEILGADWTKKLLKTR